MQLKELSDNRVNFKRKMLKTGLNFNTNDKRVGVRATSFSYPAVIDATVIPDRTFVIASTSVTMAIFLQ